MDPVTLVGVFASLIQIGDVVHKSIKKLTELKSAYRNVPLVATTLIGQLYIIQVALEHLASIWDSQNFTHHSRYQQVALQMETALESFSPLMLSLQTKLGYIGDDEALLTMKNKTLFLWHEKEMSDFCSLIDRQVNALNLLLQAIQCRTWIEQQQLMEHKENQAVLQLARDCSSSIIGLPDHDRESIVTELTNDMSVEFEFDSLILGCRPYLSAHRSHLREVIHSTRPIAGPNASQSQDHQLASSNVTREASTDQEEVATIRSASFAATDSGDPQDLEFLHRASTEPLPRQPRFNFVTEHFRLLDEIAVSLRPPLMVHSPDGSERTGRDIYRDSNVQEPTEPRPQLKQAAYSTDELLFEHKSRRRETSTLVLGTSGSGKSTLLKGLKYLFEGDYTREEREDFRETVLSNLLTSFRWVLENFSHSTLSFADKRNRRHRALLLALRDDLARFPPEVVSAMKALWADRGFQEHFARQHKYRTWNDNLEYYVQSIDRLQMKKYLPSSEDILRTQVMTHGITEYSFFVNSSVARFYDVGGTRSQRKKWVHRFDNVDNVYFVVDTAAYGRPLFEDESEDRMEEQFMVFKTVVNYSWLDETKFLLVFSRIDCLEQHLSTNHPAKHFPDFEPTERQRMPTVDEYMTYLERRFTDLIESPYHKVNTRILRANLVDMKTLWACRERFDTDAGNLL